jgi:hypothetical protein
MTSSRQRRALAGYVRPVEEGEARRRCRRRPGSPAWHPEIVSAETCGCSLTGRGLGEISGMERHNWGQTEIPGRLDATWILRRRSHDPAAPTMGGPGASFQSKAAEGSLPGADGRRGTAEKAEWQGQA